MDVIGDPARFHVYEYHFLDDLSFVQAPRAAELFSELSDDELHRATAAVRERFLSAGWEGDGQIGIIWLPPFVDVGIEDTWGNYVWHVKQDNNGTSWLASRYPLDFRRLADQNDKSPWATHEPASIVHGDCVNLAKAADDVAGGLARKLSLLAPLDPVPAAEIRADLVLSAQGILVRELNEFLDDCYLRILIEVLDNGNPSRLKLSRFKASLDPARYVPDTIEPDDEEEGSSSWFTLKGLIRDIWWSFKFEPFKMKVDMLFKPSGYKVDDAVKRDLVKHVLMRNCIQHHGGQLTADTLREAGLKVFTVVGDGGTTHTIDVWKKIQFGADEVSAFARTLRQLAEDYDRHIRKRVRSVVWEPIK